MAAYVTMGRHSSAGNAAAGTRVAWLAVLGAVIAAAVISFGVTRGLGGEASADAAASSTEDAAEAFQQAMDDAHASHSDEPTDEETTTEEPEPTQEPEPTEDGPSAALASCIEQVQAGESLAEAAATSASHWKTHYMQTVKLNAGDIELDEATKKWAETKAEGPKDLERFSGAQEAYQATEGACSEVTPEDAGDTVDAEELTACVDRSETLATVAERGAKVNADWKAHQEQMAAKADYPADEYYEWWLEVVDAAPKNMKPYEEAVKDLEEAPACTLTR